MFPSTQRLMSPKFLRITIALGVTIGIIIFLSVTATFLPHPLLPKITLTYANQSIYNESKVALLIESRPQPIIVPLMLKFMYQMPPDWRFRFMGSPESVAFANQSAAMREHVKSGKVNLTYIPSNMSTAGQEMISRFLTTLRLYDTVLQPAEILLVFQTDSMVCANNKRSIDDFIGYDWRRIADSEPEDVWLSERLGHHNAGSVANGSISSTFSGEMNGGPAEIVPEPECDADLDDDQEECEHENLRKKLDEQGRPGEWVKGLDDWRDGFYEPMGYHIGGAGQLHGPVWGKKKEKREHIYKYCPEAKMILEMDWADYIPGNCEESW
ncbi:hypothetical protein FSOLCH5_011542 [Fusarium solani]